MLNVSKNTGPHFSDKDGKEVLEDSAVQVPYPHGRDPGRHHDLPLHILLRQLGENKVGQQEVHRCPKSDFPGRQVNRSFSCVRKPKIYVVSHIHTLIHTYDDGVFSKSLQ